MSELALGRLIAVRVGAEGHGRYAVARLRQLDAQALRGIGLREELGLEIQARRELEIGVARTRVAIHATVLAAPVRVDGLLERDIRGIVARDDGARALHGDRRRQRRRFFRFPRPAVVDGRALDGLEAPGLL